MAGARASASEEQLLAMLEAQNQLLEQDNRAVQPGSIAKHAGSEGDGASDADETSSVHSVQSVQSLQGAVSVTAASSRASSPTSSLLGINAECDEGQLLEEWSQAMAGWEVYSRKRSRRLGELVQLGIPAPFRCMAWQLLADRMSEAVAPGTTTTSSSSSSSSSGAGTASTAGAGGEGRPDYAGLLEQTSPHERFIRRDIARTYPTHTFFSGDGMGQEVLFNVIKAYSLYDTEVGYCQGSPFVVGLLLMHMPEEEAFSLFIQLMQHYKMRNLFKPSMADLPVKLFQFDSLVQTALPALYEHLEEIGVESSSFASQWFLTLFGSSLPLPLVFRIFDQFLFEGVPAVFRAGLAILKHNAEFLARQGFEQVLALLTKSGLSDRYANLDDAESLMATMRELRPVTPKRLARMAKDYATQKAKADAERSELARLKAANTTLSSENKQLKAKVASLEEEMNTLAEKMLQTSVRLHAKEEELYDMQQVVEEFKRLQAVLSEQSAAAAAAGEAPNLYSAISADMQQQQQHQHQQEEDGEDGETTPRNSTDQSFAAGAGTASPTSPTSPTSAATQ